MNPVITHHTCRLTVFTQGCVLNIETCELFFLKRRTQYRYGGMDQMKGKTMYFPFWNFLYGLHGYGVWLFVLLLRVAPGGAQGSSLLCTQELVLAVHGGPCGTLGIKPSHPHTR